MKLQVTYIESTLFICSQRPGSMVVVSLVQTLLEEIKQSSPLNVNSHIFRFENYCLQLIIMGEGDNMQLLLPK